MAYYYQNPRSSIRVGLVEGVLRILRSEWGALVRRARRPHYRPPFRNPIAVGRSLTDNDLHHIEHACGFSELQISHWLDGQDRANQSENIATNAALIKAVRVFARILYRESEGGQHLGSRPIQRASESLVQAGICNAYPCPRAENT